MQDYRRIFVDDDELPPLANRLDAVLASVGPSGVSRTVARSNESYGGVPQRWMMKWLQGDLGGVVIERPTDELSAEDQKDLPPVETQLKRLKNHWGGVQEQHLLDCANNARKHETPGGIVLGVGWSRAKVILSCLHRGLINTLCIDQYCADALLGLLNPDDSQ